MAITIAIARLINVPQIGATLARMWQASPPIDTMLDVPFLTSGAGSIPGQCQSQCISGTPLATSLIARPGSSIGPHNWTDFKFMRGTAQTTDSIESIKYILNYLLILTNGIQIAIRIVGKCFPRIIKCVRSSQSHSVISINSES